MILAIRELQFIPELLMLGAKRSIEQSIRTSNHIEQSVVRSCVILILD
jgi:hypothetical protein